MKDSANSALVQSVVQENIAGILEDFVQVALDVTLDDTIWRDIPIVSWLVKAGAIGRGIRERLFLKKIALFLMEARKISSPSRQAFARRLSEDTSFADSCGERVLMLLDRLSEAAKARLIGYAFRRFVQGDIDEVILNRLYSAVELLQLYQLIDLPEYYFQDGLGSLNQSAAASYQQLGFVEMYYGDKDKRLHCDFPTGESHFVVYHQPFYRPTHIGNKVAQVIRDYLDEPDSA